MSLLTLYRRESETSGILILFMGVISGMAQAALLGIITIAADTASQQSLNFRYLCLFAIAFAIMFIGKRYALQQANTIVEQIIKRVRVRIADKIRTSELLFLERLGKGELYTRLAHDTNFISESAVIIVNASQSALLVVFCLFFVAILSKTAFLITIGFSSLGISVYFLHAKGLGAKLSETRAKESIFFEMINQILGGFKELKMNRKKSEDYFGLFKNLAHETESLKISIERGVIVDLMFSQVAFYALLACIVFLLPWLERIDAELIIRVTAAILFIIGPINMIVGSIPLFIRANIAIDQLYHLESQLDALVHADVQEEELPVKPSSFGKIGLEALSFSYYDHDAQAAFTVGPVNFELRQGEVIFLIGGNGSGKTTLLKLLTGLYYPDSGAILVDGHPIAPKTYQAYRELFAPVFHNFHLFDRLYGQEDTDDEAVRELIRLMELEQKTDVSEGHFTNLDLSTGQRKRLAMIAALLDDRPIYVLDEWAADQDPHFRKYFYEVLLQELKTQGKTIIAVSHDDRYFHVADRVVKMDYGQLIGENITI